jgi:predicted nucleotidyltransferase
MGNIFNTDFRDFIQALNNNKVEYLLVGGYAVILHGYSRTTGDMDIWVNRTSANYQKLLSAFNEFKMPAFDMTEENFLNHLDWDVFRYGRKPVAIDIMTKMGGLNFDECYATSKEYNDDGLIIKLVHYDDLIKAKKAAGRHKDLNDLENLEPGTVG